jgi:predicted dehydrogenase
MGVNRLKIALVGCGQIADAHLQEIRKIAYTEVVAVCDRQADLAEQAAARFNVPGRFVDAGKMLATVRPHVVHITTPPQTHAPLARQALAAGAHVYVEKPFTVDASEADQVLAAARVADRLVCVGHDQLFDPAWEECRRLVHRGDLGEIVHVDSVQGYDLSGPFGRVLNANPDHWVHQLPGGLFQNVISHALYKVTEFLHDERPQIWAEWFSTVGGARYPTDLHVVFRGERVTATLLFLSGARPVQRVARVYGARKSIEVDLDGRLIRHAAAAKLPGPFAKLEMPARHLCESARTLGRSLWRFARSDLQYFAGMNRLFRTFYDRIRHSGEPPIAYDEIYRVTAIMDDIFTCCRESELTGRNSRNGHVDRRPLLARSTGGWR